MDVETSIQVADYVVCVVVLLIPMAIGILFAVKDAKKATREEYLFGGRRMSVVPIALSLFASYMSAISLIGTTADMYTYGAMITLLYVGFSVSYIIGLFTIVPLFYSLQLTSIYEYFMLRFHSRAVRMSALAVGMVQNICYMAVALYTPALGLQTTANIPLWMSIVIVGIIGTVYSALGGIKSVVWADAFRCFVMFGGALPIIISGLITNRNQILPFSVMHALKDMPGLAGLFMAKLFSASLSTISSGMNALAAITVEDVLKNFLGGFQESRITLFTKLLVCVYGLIIIGLAYLANSLQGPVTQLGASIFGACGGPMFGVFILGACIPWSNKYGALGGGLTHNVVQIIRIGNQ
ncbi:sodium-coupled monocarboxylate transporter 1-like [Physella acuta]|uniref:sodium-coupled monocarboxylate transporter 1-like n=1 Tax=Physella acuta TaxID=109671 RepID=UPI0027DC7980|nr:sodium-coupled monocarboxylate transporter 1-like [Physella acuta]